MYPENEKTETSAMTDLLIVLAVLSAVAVYYYGLRGALVIIISSVVCCVTDMICVRLRKREVSFRDVSALITGATLGLMMPASVPYYVIISAAIFSIVIAKQAFGGHGCEIFNAAAAGFLFVSICFPENVLTYPDVFAELPLSSFVPSEMLGPSLARTFIATGSANISFIDIMAGRSRGAMGTGAAAVIIIAAVFLMFRRTVSAIVLLTEIVVSGTAVFFLNGCDIMSVLYFFAGGMTLFGMVFLSCLMGTVPKTKTSQLIYGIILGGITVLLQYYSKAENAVIYSVILAAPFCIELDKRSLSFAEMMKNKKGIFSGNNKHLQNMRETLDMIDKNSGEK